MSILDNYKQAYPNLDDDKIFELCAYEAFIRRASLVGDEQFMLKGSFLTREYLPNPKSRIPDDLDFLCLHKFTDGDDINKVLSSWVQAVTIMRAYDGVQFTPFKDTGSQWYNIDYAMAEDFPTVNTYMKYTIDGQTHDIYLDISFNLPIYESPAPMTIHTPIDEFICYYSAPLSHQIAWKIHQSITRPRYKDIYDLTYLVYHANINIRDNALQALVNECAFSGIYEKNIMAFFDYNPKIFEKIYPNKSKANIKKYLDFEYECFKKNYHIADDFDTVWRNFVHAMKNNGFGKGDFIMPKANV